MRLNIISNNITEARLCLLEYLIGNNIIPNKILYYSKGIFLEPFFKKINNECSSCIVPHNCLLLIDNIMSEMINKLEENYDETGDLVIFSTKKINHKFSHNLDFIYLNPIFSLKTNFIEYYHEIIKKFQNYWNDKYYLLHKKINNNLETEISEIEEIEKIEYFYDNPEILNNNIQNDDWIFF